MTKGYDIIVDVDRLLHSSKTLFTKVSTETLLLIVKEFSEYLLSEYYTEIYNAVYSRRYEGYWEPVESQDYRNYLGCEPTSTNILDLIYDAFYIREKKKYIYIGIDDKVRYPGSRKTLLQVLKAIDKGTSKINARPAITPAYRYLSRTYKKLWNNYLYMKGVI